LLNPEKGNFLRFGFIFRQWLYFNLVLAGFPVWEKCWFFRPAFSAKRRPEKGF
jgi:hypothetical protein